MNTCYSVISWTNVQIYHLDTDGILISIAGVEDLNEFFKSLPLLDTSNFSKNNPLYSEKK